MTENVQTAVNIGDGRYDHVWKVVLLGDSGVGKSSLLHRFTQNEFKDDMRSGIIGDDLSTKILEVEGKTIKIKFWDTYGQKRFKSVNQAFYRGAVGAMLVYDITNSTTFENLEGWLDELQLPDENTVIMLLGNKCDRNDDREVPAKNAEMFAEENNLLFMETSAVDAMYVAAAFQYLCNEIYKMVKLKESQETSDTEIFFNAVENQPGKLDLKVPTDNGQNSSGKGQPAADNEDNTTRTAQLPKRLCCTYV